MLLKNKLEKFKSLLKNDNVLANLEERYCYTTDAGNLEKTCQIPDLVVFVETIEEVQAVVQYANMHSIPIVARGAGTNMVGACVCTEGGIILNFSKMNKILEINPVNMTAKVQPGVVLGDLKICVSEYGLFFPPDPSNYRVSTIGGAIAQSSGGALAFKYGTIKDYILSLKVVTADGKLMTLGAETTKDSVGYHLGQLIVGSEGTLAIVVEATLKLIPAPESKKTVAAYFNSVENAVSVVNNILASHIYPSAIDFLDNNSITTIEEYISCGINKSANCMLLLEIDGFESSILEQFKILEKIFKTNNVIEYEIANDAERADTLWRARHSSYAASAKLAPDIISDDIIVPRAVMCEILKYCQEISLKYDLKMCVVGHIGDGNLHPQVALNLENEEEFKKYELAKSEIYKKVVELGGNISAEHGVGLEKLSYIDSAVDKNALEYMRLIKKVFDPNNILNPGKIFKL